ncbi:DUF2634 domain-containing protein [Brevibacillus brevis]|uniref:DUF2634 domain-containing protein n=1 Tax=Brevibacillus brevis TaxID=1393 RepID=UPI000D10BCF0|nr:DUF2634 domain-containing protein [Brevibacillus brevis]PSJ69438.1 hypothetical protein C7J99_09830 [Brevibacillus brevis]RED21236.1 uncharacterized protein DUF2634 [Brevibacillus brevis]GEC93504.1 hypothetical protein BBR01nite_58350 [Brevibacillus brevis]VEF90137.1 Protein of uncharacterised function (DUF2634) [Brevibacillus brevis]
MSLPQIAQLDLPQAQITQQMKTQTVHKTYLWDFVAGDFVLKDGKLIEVTGLEYIKVWIEKILRTVKRSLIYAETEYGSEHHSLIGQNFHPDFSRSEYERMIREALLQNEAITKVDNFSFSQTGSRLEINFEVSSIYGTVERTVSI